MPENSRKTKRAGSGVEILSLPNQPPAPNFVRLMTTGKSVKVMPSILLLTLTLLVAAQASASAGDALAHTFRKTQLTDKFWCEGATLGDLNRDSVPDLVSGPFWYEGPDYKKKHHYYPATHTFQRKKEDGTAET